MTRKTGLSWVNLNSGPEQLLIFCLHNVMLHTTISILSTRLDKALLLILRLRLLRPLGRLILPILLFLIAFLFRLMNSLRIVLGRRVNGIQDLIKSPTLALLPTNRTQ